MPNDESGMKAGQRKRSNGADGHPPPRAGFQRWPSEDAFDAHAWRKGLTRNHAEGGKRRADRDGHEL